MRAAHDVHSLSLSLSLFQQSHPLTIFVNTTAQRKHARAVTHTDLYYHGLVACKANNQRLRIITSVIHILNYQFAMTCLACIKSQTRLVYQTVSPNTFSTNWTRLLSSLKSTRFFLCHFSLSPTLSLCLFLPVRRVKNVFGRNTIIVVFSQQHVYTRSLVAAERVHGDIFPIFVRVVLLLLAATRKDRWFYKMDELNWNNCDEGK